MANRTVRVVAAVIEREGRYLITQRRAEAVLGGLWEFPGGRVEENEADEDALRREVEHRLGVEPVVGVKLAERHHAYDGYDVHLTLFRCSLPEGSSPEARRVSELRWVRSDEFNQYPFPPADQATMDQLLGFR